MNHESNSVGDFTCDRDLVIGVLGGMGPEATADFYMKLLSKTVAVRDQDHFRVLIDSNGKVPDRVEAIMGNGESPVPILTEMAKGLERGGADFIVIPCNTAHYYYNAISSAVSIPVLHIARELFARVDAMSKISAGENSIKLNKIGLLATTATIYTRLYQQLASEREIELLVPTEQEQEELVSVGIKAVKAGDKILGQKYLTKAANILVARGARALIEGCTEVPLVLEQSNFSVPLLDSTAILAEATVTKARHRYECKHE